MEKLVKRDDEVVQLLRTDGRKGEFLARSQYTAWSMFILAALANEEDLTLNDLLEKASKKGSPGTEHETGWYILQVKRDLEARGLIQVMAGARKHIFFLKLTRQGLAKVHYETQFSDQTEK